MNKNRLIDIFLDLVKIHSPSLKEKGVCEYIINFCKNLNAEIYLDNSFGKYGGNSPSVFVRLDGTSNNGYCFNAHMDVVEPSFNPKLIVSDDIIKTDGKTTLGSDDKAGIAIILYILEYFSKLKNHPTITAIFTPAEEIGMLGARNINWKEVSDKFLENEDLIVIDNANDCKNIAIKAPSAIVFEARVYGKKAHAGIEPENGINAIKISTEIISKLKLGRIDSHTTMNISKIHSDFPTNVIPDNCVFSGEIRAHDKDILFDLKDNLLDLLKKEAYNYEFDWNVEYPPFETSDLNLFEKMKSAFKTVAIDCNKKIIGGGSDANFFYEKGFNPIIIGCGMYNVHTTDEFLKIDQFVKTTKAIINLLNERS
ncbi:MAG: M20/M25/M40 family metallo-hydrolase [Tissierellia bacterium]|nr:M20/M25/M40 family metallo-hydrolase [Tissierellia bacterium]